ncbi:amidohydrolase family protein [Paenibacillus bouchesdurhonensis]|uniref:amidohydrolase family protein n=1 Tax=Paenibacillus bouchesdurhonensis TaxID=1870990 RepID=UPI000DA62E3C|nr:amidohydrolase family protein [Paenibacillus bouchesdurhonensis]
MRIDAHQHYWRIERGDYGWITPDIPTLYRDFLPVDLEPLLREHRLDGSILVQAAPTVEETEYILSIAEQASSVLGVVGWLDLHQPDHRRHYERFRRHPKFVGFRLMIQDMPDSSRILERDFVQALQGYASEDVPIDLLVVSGQLEHTLELIRQVPNLRGVIDHMAKPPVKTGETEPWFTYMEEIAQFPGMYCKLSGMVTEGDHQHWKPEDFKPYMERIIRLFGSARVMFGSDWPVCLLAGEYSEVIELLLSTLPETWGEAELSRVFGRNAVDFYKLG